MSYYFLEKRKLNEVTLPVNCEEWHMSANAVNPELRKVHLHNHEPLELIVVQSGTVMWTADSREYRLSAGDVLLLNPYVLHSAQVPQNAETVYICITFSLNAILGFRKSVLSQCAAAVTDGIYCFDEFYPADTPAAVRISTDAKTINDHFHEKTPVSECEVISSLYRLLTFLLESYYHEDNTFDTYKRNKQFLQKLSLFLDENYSKPITAKDVANALYLSPSRFSHVFHQHFGISFPNYLCQYRIRRAAAYYADSTLPITEIAEAVGFSDYCYFSRSFKKYIGKTPAVYFGRWKTNDPS